MYADVDEHFKLKDRTIDIVLSSFDKPIKFDYPIPGNISKLMAQALTEMCKEGEFNSDYYGTWFNPKTNLFEKRVLKGLKETFECGKEERSYIESELAFNDNKFGDEWFYGYGTLHKFRQGEREKATELAKKYWNEQEMQDFKEINRILANVTNKYYQEKRD